MNSLEFLEEIYPDKPENAYLLLWKNKKSMWFKDIEKAAKQIEKEKKDIYYGVGLSPKDYGPNRRCKSNHIFGIPGLYADIDIGGSKNGKKYPPTIDDGISLFDNTEFRPTMIVNSGNGLHMYWLFKEFWEFENQTERTFAARLCKRINKFAQDQAGVNGWVVDQVGDLARILRPVGSINCKKDPKTVELIDKTGTHFLDYEHFDDFLPQIDEYLITPQEISDKELARLAKIMNLKVTAEPPQDKLDLLLDHDPEFKVEWQRKVTGDKKDKSDSGYHYRMALKAATVGWSDQEIGDLLVAWNRRHALDMHKVLERPEYVNRTIMKAKSLASKILSEKYSEELEIKSSIAGEDYIKATKEADRKKALENLSSLLGFKVLGITNYKGEKKNRYKMSTQNYDDIFFMGSDELMQRNKFQIAIMAATNIALSLTPAEFKKVLRTYRYIIIDKESTLENTIKNRTKAWIKEYLEEYPQKNMHDAVRSEHPFVHNKHWFIYLNRFREWAYRKKHDREDPSKTEFDFELVDAVKTKLSPNNPYWKEGDPDKKKRITKRPWKIPHKVIKP